MMNKKFSISLGLAVVVLLLVVGVVVAGATLEYGQVETEPPIGELNYFAWLDKSANIRPEGMPEQIYTEENFNSDLGEGGYQNLGSGIRVWLLQVENFDNRSHGDPVKMIFGGLGASSGKLWFYDFTWDQLTDTATWHDIVPLSEQEEACPMITNMGFEGSTKNVTFNHRPSSTYHVYRATQPSGAPNQLSSGRYNYLKTVTTNTSGVGTFSDVFAGDAWYVVIRADPATKKLVGCHSEIAFPTNVRVIDFSAAYLTETGLVELTWETANEMDIQGFNLYRNDQPGLQGRVKLNAALLPSTQPPGSLEGDSYSFIDDFAFTPGQTYYYWLEVVGYDQSRSPGGADSVLIPANGGADTLYYLPLILN